MTKSTRRAFLQSSTAVAGAALAVPNLARSSQSANERVRVAVVGLGGRSQSHLRSLHELAKENVEIAALCDCDDANLHKRAAFYKELSGKTVPHFSDMRKLFEDKSIDAVSFATPDHWHALGTIWACQAGKDVYLEKPGTHNLFEGRQMVAAARKYRRIVQHGTQCRSSPNIREGIAKLKAGAIGKVYMARAISYKLRGELGRHRPAAPPKGFDWDQWLGPAPEQPYSEFRHRRWYWCWDYSSGDMANQAVHQLDIIRWGLGLDTHPVRIQSMGGHFVHDDDQETPNHQTFACQYENGALVQFEHRSWITPSEAGFREPYPFVDHHNAVGAIFFGTDGYMIFPDYSSYRTFLGRKREPGPSAHLAGEPMMDTEHFRNWIAAVRSRKPGDLTAEIEECRLSMSPCLLGNVAYRTGRTLVFDPKTEQCIGDAEANALLAPRYRSPYAVPQEV
jgi:predicted dehydrogenase